MAAACALLTSAMPLNAPFQQPASVPIIPCVEPLARSASMLERPKLTPKRSHRPPHRRSRSSRESADPLHQIRRVLQAFLPGPKRDFVAISQDFFAVAVGLSPAFVLHDYGLDMAETNRMGFQLSQILSTTDVVLMVDQVSRRLIVAETHSLVQRATDYCDDQTFFMRSDADHADDIIPPRDVGFMVTGCPRLLEILARSDSQVISTDDLLWTGVNSSAQLTTLTEWLQRFPVCYVDDARTPSCPSSPKAGVSWSLQAQLDGKDFVNDHRLQACRVPAAIFPFDSLTRDSSHVSKPGSPVNLSLATMQDNMQTYYFDRLNGSDLAANVWDNVIVEANLC